MPALWVFSDAGEQVAAAEVEATTLEAVALGLPVGVLLTTLEPAAADVAAPLAAVLGVLLWAPHAVNASEAAIAKGARGVSRYMSFSLGLLGIDKSLSVPRSSHLLWRARRTIYGYNRAVREELRRAGALR